MQNFKDLDAYRLSKEVAVYVYELSKRWPKEEIYGLTSQIRRAAVSVNSNLAEGCGRLSSNDTAHFLAIARGSNYELESQAEIAFELGYLDQDQLNHLLTLNDRSRMTLNGMIKRYKGL